MQLGPVAKGKSMRRVELDIVRAIATLIVVVFHFNCSFDQYDVTGFHSFIYLHANGDFGQMAVVMFWLLSGASLISRYGNEDFDLRQFYKRRMLSIYPVYYVSWIYIYIYMAYIRNIYPKLEELNWRIIFTFTALDGWLYSITSTFFLVGEWFTGVIVILYAIFPLLRWLYRKHYVEGCFVIGLIYFLNFKFQILFFGNGYFSLSGGLALFWLGMTIERFRERLYGVNPAYYGVVFLALLLIPLPFTTLIELSVMGIMLYLFLCSTISRLSLEKTPIVIKWMCKYSYIFYTIHHRIYYNVFDGIRGNSYSVFGTVLLFGKCAVIIVLLSMLVKATERGLRYVVGRLSQQMVIG